MFPAKFCSLDIYEYLCRKFADFETKLDIYARTDLDGILTNIAFEIHKELVAKEEPKAV